MARNIYGLDLGTYEIKVYDKKQDNTWKEKNVIAIVDGKEILAVGDEAYAMFELVSYTHLKHIYCNKGIKFTRLSY